jgi:hypothetical protein
MKFEIIHAIKGTRKTIVTVPDIHPLPEGWSSLHIGEQDDWIYSHQSSNQVIFEDLHHAEAYSIEWLD